MPLLGAAVLGAMAAPAPAPGRVHLELIGDSRGSALAFQEWLRVLSRAGVKDIRIRSGQPTDRAGVEVRGTKDSPLYVVTGLVLSRDELLLPVGKFRRRDVGRLAQWLDDLAEHGPADQREPKSAFGLSSEQFERIEKEMAQPVGFSTRGRPRREVVDRIRSRLKLPLLISPQVAQVLEEDNVEEELSSLSGGTALAYVLRPMGLCLVPRQAGGRLECEIIPARPNLVIWPVGWDPEQPRHKTLPALFKVHNINVQGVSAAAAMSAIGKRLQVPLLVDHNALALHGIEPERIMVSHPGRRTTYSIALRKILSQARLKSEVRVDEAGQPFLWVSTVKPI